MYSNPCDPRLLRQFFFLLLEGKCFFVIYFGALITTATPGPRQASKSWSTRKKQLLQRVYLKWEDLTQHVYTEGLHHSSV